MTNKAYNLFCIIVGVATCFLIYTLLTQFNIGSYFVPPPTPDSGGNVSVAAVQTTDVIIGGFDLLFSILGGLGSAVIGISTGGFKSLGTVIGISKFWSDDDEYEYVDTPEDVAADIPDTYTKDQVQALINKALAKQKAKVKIEPEPETETDTYTKEQLQIEIDKALEMRSASLAELQPQELLCTGCTIDECIKNVLMEGIKTGNDSLIEGIAKLVANTTKGGEDA